MPSSIAVLSPDSRPCLLFALLSVQLVMLKTRKFPLAIYHLLFTSLLEFSVLCCASISSFYALPSLAAVFGHLSFYMLCCLHVHCKVLLSINMWEEKITKYLCIYLSHLAYASVSKSSVYLMVLKTKLGETRV